MNLPPKYQWIETIGTLPKLVVSGLSYLGLKEYPGSANNPIIINMAKELDVDDIYKSDSLQAWCALFMFHLLKINGKPLPSIGNDKYNYLRAKTFINYGNPVQKGDEMLGDILVFERPEGFHVALNIAESPATFIILGGNQSNSVSFTEILKSRLIAARRFYSTAQPPSVKKYLVDSSGKVSANEK